MWDAATGQEKAVLRGHEGPVSSAVFSPDGQTVLTASWDNTARLYVARMEDLVALAKTRLTRELSCPERVRFLQSTEVCQER